MYLGKYLGKRVQIIDVDGDITTGKCVSYTPALDNDPEIESIDIEIELGADYAVTVAENEIKSIEVI